jgi:multidrug efflux pump subunit AcrA (membrane-fusion protein)
MSSAKTRRINWLAGSLLLAALVIVSFVVRAQPSTPESQRRDTSSTVSKRDFTKSIRVSGTVEAVEATTISTPRLAGQNNQSLVVTSLVRPGSMVRKGDLLVEFDRQDQLKNALDRRVELNDLEQQIRKKDAEAGAARAKDDSELVQAENSLSRAQLEMLKNEMLPKIQAEKNTQAYEEAQAKLKQLKTTYELKRRAAQADLRILEIRRDRADNAMRQAESNADRMSIQSPIDGMAVIKSIWKSNNMAEVQEGEEVRSGMPIVDVVNPASMRVRAKVNQADIADIKVGLPVRIGLDAYPDLSFTGKVVQISPMAITSTLSPKVRTFIALIAVDGSHPNLMPDLTASLDVELIHQSGVLVIPRDALRFDGEQVYVRVQRNGAFADQQVTVGPMNAHEAVIVSGLAEGATIDRHLGGSRGAR